MAQFTLSRNSTIALSEARTKAKANLLTVVISPNKEWVELGESVGNFIGVLKSKPKYAIDASYQRLINLDDKFSKWNKLTGAAGVEVGLSKTWSRQIYKGGSYLKVELSMRVLATKEKRVQDQTAFLFGLCSPREVLEGGDVKETETNISNINSPQEFINGFLGGAISKVPPTCKIEISNYIILENMIIKSLSFDFSHEQNTTGPIYADIDIGVEQVQIEDATTMQNAFSRWRPSTNIETNVDLGIAGA